MSLTIFQVDAFTSKPFGGNPAAVCILPEPREAEWMQNVALEMNLSETAFLVKQAEGYDLRWFTPAVEVDLCGHATLASAHILYETSLLTAGEEARFHSRSGLLTARKAGNFLELNFPAVPATPQEPPAGLLDALHVVPRFVGKNRMDFLVEVETETEVRGLQPDFAQLSTLGVRGVMVTARATSSGFDFVSRFFAPGSGINEDPVTGSAHCCLGPYWQGRLGKSEFRAYQASARGGEVRVVVEGERVRLGGQAITVMRAELYC